MEPPSLKDIKQLNLVLGSCNGYRRKKASKVVIDPHYEVKHSTSIYDQVILRLVRQLDGRFFETDDADPPPSWFGFSKTISFMWV